MTIKDIMQALEKVENNMSNPELPVDIILKGCVQFANGCTYSLITGERIA